MQTDSIHRAPFRTRVLRYFGLVNDPAAPLELRRPVYGPAMWAGLACATTVAALVALRIAGYEWSAVGLQLGAVYAPAALAGALLPLRWSRRVSAPPQSAPATAKLRISRWPTMHTVFIALSLMVVASDPGRHVSAVVLVGLWLGMGVATDIGQRRAERRFGQVLYSGNDGAYYAVPSQAVSP